jgi:glycosyltransferase involved in cell wall biosynthesis
MRIAFYAPLKPPDHPTPSGDRLMANLLMKALRLGGHDVVLASRLRTYSADPNPERYEALKAAALEEASTLVRQWSRGKAGERPDCWFTYHIFFKSPDWIGPAVSRALAIPYVAAETSYAAKRDSGPWRDWQADVVEAIRHASLNLCFTERDREGLQMLEPNPAVAMLPPFLDPPPRPVVREAFGDTDRTRPVRLVTVAMMRPGNKLASYVKLAEALQLIVDAPWTLTVIGDGAARPEVHAAFSSLPAARIMWRGLLDAPAVAETLAPSDLFLWPGVREPFGLVFLEAQAMGLPVIGFDDGGVTSVVRHGETGLLVPANDVHALASAARRLIDDPALRTSMGAAACRFAREERSVARAAKTLDVALRGVVAPSLSADIADPGESAARVALEEELGHWSENGRKVTLWLRDDDATEVTLALGRLAGLAGRHGVPCLLAVIPVGATEGLASWTADRPLIDVALHGYAHRNHAGPEAKQQEFIATRPLSDLTAEIEWGSGRLAGLFGSRYTRIFVPPWNRIASEIASQLPILGMRALSTFGRRSVFSGPPPLPEINAHIDIMDWRARRGRAPAAVVIELTQVLATLRDEENPIIGLLTHHLVHDDAAWCFLETLFALTAKHPAVVWRRAADLLPQAF